MLQIWNSKVTTGRRGTGTLKSWFLTNQTGFPPEFAAQFWVRVFYFSVKFYFTALIPYPAEEEEVLATLPEWMR